MANADDHVLAARIASETGDLLVRLLDEYGSSKGPRGGIEYLGDRTAHEFIVAELARHRPDDAVLSEEGHDDSTRLDASRVWIVDPLDGSSNYGWSATWSVHVALVEAGRPMAGAVAVPGWETTWATDPQPRPIMSRVGSKPLILVSRARRNVDGGLLHRAMDVEIAALGSAGVKAMAVVRGEADAYVHGGYLYEWDSCAPVAVAQAAGLSACRIDGTELEFNKARPTTSGLIICRPELRDGIVDAMAWLD